MSENRILCLKSPRRLEWRGQDGQDEAEQSEHSPQTLGDSLGQSMRIRFSVHTAEPTAPYFHNAVRAQMIAVLDKAQKIFAAAGASLNDLVRVLQFHSDLSTFYDTYLEWEKVIGDGGLPFSAVQVNDAMFVPGADMIVDLWGYIPGQDRC